MLRYIRLFSSRPTIAPLLPTYSQGERIIHEKLANQLEATNLVVEDMSGGCGSMYKVSIASPKFAGVPLLKQHRMVSEILKDEIKGMHGIQINTKVA
ncbi:bola protein [Globomyces pollinis-pini]|nr:bola protein [Globomyces pollinis-pini]